MMALAVIPAGCVRQPAGSGEPPRAIVRLDCALADPASGLDSLEQSAFAAWMEMNGIPSATQADRAVYAASAPVRVFQPDVDSLLAPLDSVERILGHALAAYGDSLLRLMAVVSPYNQSVCFHRGGGYVFIALNHYLGRDYAGYAGRFPAYMLHRKDLRRLPSDVMETVMASVSPEQIRPGATFLNRMLYSGALAYCVLQTMPEGTPESVVLGLADSQWQWCVDNEERLWRSLIERQLLYSSDPAVADRLLRPAPASPLLGPSAPGQAACFIGLRVVQAFAGKYPGKATPGYLLSPEFYNSDSSLIQSQYNPRNGQQR